MKLGLPEDEAIATFGYFAEHELGCEPGTVPGGRITHYVRVCRECAAKAGAKVAKVGADEIPCTRQPDDEDGDE